MKKNLYKTILIIFFTLAITSCGFHLRSGSDIPTALHRLYLKTPNPNSTFTANLRNTLHSLNIKLAPTAKTAPYRLLITHYNYTHSNPTVISSNQAVTFHYHLQVAAELTNKKNNPILPAQTFTAERSITLNANQIYNATSAPLLKREMEHEIINDIFNWLSSMEIKHALTQPVKPYGNKLKTT